MWWWHRRSGRGPRGGGGTPFFLSTPHPPTPPSKVEVDAASGRDGEESWCGGPCARFDNRCGSPRGGSSHRPEFLVMICTHCVPIINWKGIGPRRLPRRRERAMLWKRVGFRHDAWNLLMTGEGVASPNCSDFLR